MVFSYNEDYVIGTDASNNMIVVWDSQTGEIMRKIKSNRSVLYNNIVS